MVDLSAAIVTQLSVHQVGNQSADEGYFLTAQPTIIDDQLSESIRAYCQQAFSRETEIYHFSQEVDLSYHVMHGLSGKYFADSTTCHSISQAMTRHLYSQSMHPHIKPGDVLIVRLEQVLLVDELVDAIAIIKAENKNGFLRLTKIDDHIKVDAIEGIQLRRMDKGALILDVEAEEGYRVLSVDNNNYDASYWLSDFLSIEHVHDHNFDTKAYVEMCKSFAADVIRETVDKKSQVDFVQQTFQYIDQVETVEVAQFKETMFADEHTSLAFDQYKARYEQDRGITINDTFEVSEQVMKQQKRKLRNFIKLDTNIKIQLGFSNAESVDRFIERGWDDEKGMYYYKCFFNSET